MKRIKVKTQVVHTDDQVISYFDQLLHRLEEKWKLFSVAAALIVSAMLLGIIINVVSEKRESEASNLLFDGVDSLEAAGPLGASAGPAALPKEFSKLSSEFSGKDQATLGNIYEGVYRFGRGEFNGAKDAFKEAAKSLSGKSPEVAALVRYNLGLTHEALEEWSDAASTYERIAQNQPQSGFSNALLAEARARVAKRSGDQDKAVRILEEAIDAAEEEIDRVALTNALQAVRLTFTDPLPQPEPEPEAEEAPAAE